MNHIFILNIVGKDKQNNLIKLDLSDCRNVLIYGDFCAGKSNLTYQLISSAISKWESKDLQISIYTPKQPDLYDEFSKSNNLSREVITVEADFKAHIDYMSLETMKRKKYTETPNDMCRHIIVIDEFSCATNFLDLETTEKLAYILKNGSDVGIHIIATIATPFIYSSFRSDWEKYFSLLVFMKTAAKHMSEDLIESDELMFLEVGEPVIYMENEKTSCQSFSVFEY